MILCLTLIPFVGALQATDVGVAAAADRADNSHLGSAGYFPQPINPQSIKGMCSPLNTATALTTQVNFNRTVQAKFAYLQSCIQDPANKAIFTNAQAFGILIHGVEHIYVVLNNDRTYCFYDDEPGHPNTAPLELYNINKGYIKHILGYTSNQELISQVFASIRTTGTIAPSLWPALGYTPPATFDPSLLATAASAVVATHGGGEGRAAAGAGAGRVSPRENEENMRMRELIITNARLEEENAYLRTTCFELKKLRNKLWFLVGTQHDKPDMSKKELDAIIKDLVDDLDDSSFTPDHS